MRFRRLMAASMAGIMAVSSAIVCQISASAEIALIGTDVVNVSDSDGQVISALSGEVTWGGGVKCDSTALADFAGMAGKAVVVVNFTTAGGQFYISDTTEWKDSATWYNNSGTEIAVLTEQMITNGIMINGEKVTIDSVEVRTSETYEKTDDIVVSGAVGWSGDVTITSSALSGVDITASTSVLKVNFTTSGGQFYITDTTEWKDSATWYNESGSAIVLITEAMIQNGIMINGEDVTIDSAEIFNPVKSDAPEIHYIEIDDSITNGTVEVDKKTAAADEKVTLTVTPDTGYKLKSLKVVDAFEKEMTVSDGKFTMPNSDVIVSAEFEAIAVESVSVKETTSLTVGGTETLVATVTPADALDASVTWKSSDTAVATVDENGKVTAVKAGTADITATTSNGKTATCKVTVTDKVVAATAVTVDPTTAELKVGSTVTITGKVTPDDSTDKITWKSSDTAVATVDAAGKVTAVKEGTATITATAGEKSAECTVTVKAAPEKLEGAFEYAYDGSPIELEVVKASWNDSGLAAQKNTSLEMKGVTFKTTTFGELKKLYSGIVINNLEIKNVPEGIKADEISVCIYIKSGSGWSWNAFSGTSVNFADITEISDSDAIMEVGYQLNYNIPAGTSYKTDDTITINAKEEVVDPNAEIISPSTKVKQVDVKTDKNGNVTEQIAYFAISEKDAKTCESYIVTIGRGKDNKKLVREIKNCFKAVQYEAADGSDKTVVAEDGAYCVLLDITNIGNDYNGLTIKIEPKM